MRLIVNGEAGEWSATTLGDLVSAYLAQTGADPDAAVATAWNRLFVAKPLRAALLLADGDEVEILIPMQGG
ncbi:MAG: sulfur carrier protein ThiS [Elstera sp.]